MYHVEAGPAQQGAERMQCPQVIARIDRRAQGGLDDHLQAGRGRLIEQVIAAAGNDRGLELIAVKRLRAAQREHACAAL
jgi:hypothetical protein